MIAAGAGLNYDLEDLEFDQLIRGQAHLIVSAQHRFAERGWVNVADLEDERWIVGEADRGGPQFGAWPTLAAEPNIVYTLRDWPGRFGLVAAGLGVAVIPSLLLPALPPGVRVLRVEDPQTVPPRGSRGDPPRPHPQYPNGDRRDARGGRATHRLALVQQTIASASARPLTERVLP